MYSPLTVLMWRHMIVRMRKFILTPLELISPVIMLIILFAIKNRIIDMIPMNQQQAGVHNIKYMEPFPLDSTNPAAIIYTPETEYTARLMDEVGKELHLRRLGSLPDETVSKYYYGFTKDNATSEAYLINKLKESDAYVIFQDMVDSFPDHLNYTIRMKVEFMTSTYGSMSDRIEDHPRFGIIYESFMRLQWALDKNYLQMRTGSIINQTVTMQEFPFVDTSTNPMADSVSQLLIMMCSYGLLLPFVLVMARLLEERATGVQELIKMSGVSSPMLALSHLLNALPAGIIYCSIGTALLKASDVPFVRHSDGFLIFITLALHYLTIMAWAFVCSFVTKRTQYIISISMTTYMVLWLPQYLLNFFHLNRLVLLTGLLPHAPMYWFWQEVASLELYGNGVSWSTIFVSHGDHHGSVFESYIFMLVQIIILTLLTTYLTYVCPGPHGTARPPNFLWKKVTPEKILDDQHEPMVRDPQYFEEPPVNKVVGIKINKVTKVYGKERALHSVSLDVYNGEITVLLGHNGAGKTTLMSIITGMLNSTEGQVYVNGLDSLTRQREVRRQLGLCTQHNLFLANLTVIEHVMFFSMLKGSSYKEARSSATELLQELKIEDKANSMSGVLSGGMKRRLQLACALAGRADVLILDEPTSGLDVETRRELWDLLLNLRDKRTVLLSTHYMEEADALGDRVVALHNGELRCHATPMYLKKHIGTGYRLSLTTIGLPREQEVTSAVTSHSPDATMRESSLNSIAYSLPAAGAHRFPQLFGALEARRSELGIDTIGVGMPTLEEVFLKLCSNVDTSFAQEEIDSNVPEPSFKKLTGFQLYARQVRVLLMRNFYFVWSTKMSFIFMQVLLTLGLIFLFTYTLNLQVFNEMYDSPADLPLNLDLYRGIERPRALYHVDDETFRRVTDTFARVKFEPTTDVASEMLCIGQEDMTAYSKYLVGLELNDTHANVLYTTTVRHAAPVALNLLSNALAARLVPWAAGRALIVHNHPVGEARVDAPGLVEPMGVPTIATWSLLVMMMYLSTIINASPLPCKENAAGTRHIHVMSGCPPALHWLSRALFHAVLYTTLIALPTILAVVLFDREDTLSQPQALGVFLLVLVLGTLAWLAFMYLLSFNLGERGLSGILGVLLLAGLITSVVQGVFVLMDSSLNAFWSAILSIAQYCLPTHTATGAMLKTGNIARLNAFCRLNRDTCPPELHFVPGLDVYKCCELRVQPASYFEFDKFSPGVEIVILFMQFVIYMTLVIITEHGVFGGVCDWLVNKTYRPAPDKYNDQMVRAENTYVHKAIDLPNKQIPDAMLVNDVHKNYFKLIGKSCNSVKGVSFSVKKGECFGVLGVNGAGKSTTFKMIVGETCATRGQIFANQRTLKQPRGQYLRSLGYCPQFFGLDEFMTGAQNLALLLTLRGLQEADVAAEVDAWVSVVGLEQYKDQPVSQYSGGCKRRMATAAALSSGAPLTLLDEPTSGVDVSARRRVWAALRRGLRQNRAVIITSHSMDEMEALCERIVIMSAGEVCALGSPAALRAAHAAGHAVVIKVGSVQHGDETDSSTPVLRLKSDMQEKFNCSLKDEHKTMLHYHINETLQYSELFTKLELLKASYPELMEDYTVTETTLEEVFLSFAQDERKVTQTV